jgi:MFS family permease
MPKYIALMSTVFALASVVGPLMGGAITETGQWKWVFLFKYVSGLDLQISMTVVLILNEKCPSRISSLRDHHLHSTFNLKPRFSIIQFASWSAKAVHK